MEDSEDAADEKDRPRGGQAYIAGVGERDGSGEDPLVKGGEFEALLSATDGVADAGSKANFGGPCS